MSDRETSLWWVRRDLRVRDNYALTHAARADALLPIFAFDPASFGEREYGVVLGEDYPEPVLNLAASYEKLR